jgi:hypothetical protein
MKTRLQLLKVVALPVLASCAVDGNAVDPQAVTVIGSGAPCANPDFSFMTPDVKSLLWIASADAQATLNDLEAAAQKKMGRLSSAKQAKLAAAVSGLITSANVDTVTTTAPTGINAMSNAKFNNILATLELRGAIHVPQMQVTCDGTTGLIKAFAYNAPYKNPGYTPLWPIGARLFPTQKAKAAAYKAAEVNPANDSITKTGGVGKASVQITVMEQSRISKPISDINELLTGVKGVPWIQNWVQVTATCSTTGATNRVQAQFTKMPTSALWVNDALVQNHGQDGVGDFIVNYPDKLGPLNDAYDNTTDIAPANGACAVTTTCEGEDSFDDCPVVTVDNPTLTADGSQPCSTDLAVEASPLGAGYENMCFTDEVGNDDWFSVPCDAGEQFDAALGACENTQTDCVDQCGLDDGLCVEDDDGAFYTCQLGANGCNVIVPCDGSGAGSGSGPGSPGSGAQL